MIEETVHQVGHLPELYKDERSEKDLKKPIIMIVSASLCRKETESRIWYLNFIDSSSIYS